MVIGEYLINKQRIHEYFTDEIMYAIDLYYRIKKYGWPFSGGWADQPAYVTNIVFTIDEEIEKIEMSRSKNG